MNACGFLLVGDFGTMAFKAELTLCLQLYNRKNAVRLVTAGENLTHATPVICCAAVAAASRNVNFNTTHGLLQSINTSKHSCVSSLHRALVPGSNRRFARS